MNSDVVTMALRKSHTDDLSDGHLVQTHFQSTELQTETADLNCSQAELSQCQLLDHSSVEQVPLSTVSRSAVWLSDRC